MDKAPKYRAETCRRISWINRMPLVLMGRSSVAWSQTTTGISRVREIDVPHGIPGRIKFADLINSAILVIQSYHGMRLSHSRRIGTTNAWRLIPFEHRRSIRIFGMNGCHIN